MSATARVSHSCHTRVTRGRGGNGRERLSGLAAWGRLSFLVSFLLSFLEHVAKRANEGKLP